MPMDRADVIFCHVRGPSMIEPVPIVFLLDVDNTLLDNDRIVDDLKAFLTTTCGTPCETRYWKHFEEIRNELGYADYLGALQRYRVENPRDPHILGISAYLLRYPFADRVFSRAMDVIARLRKWGPAVILSDGDVVFQPWKVECSGLSEATEGHVLIYIHKERELDDVEQRYPARHYVLVDDKLRILTAVKNVWGSRVTTLFVRQGHYALDPDVVRTYPTADMTVNQIGDLLQYKRSDFVASGQINGSAT
jgi:hypothetical protein